MKDEKVTVVLAHAAWADGSSWAPVIERLRAAKQPAIAAPLPLTGLEDDVAALNRVLARTQGEIVLVGHAYSGAVISAVSSPRVKALVFMNALLPDEGETVMDVFTRTAPHPQAPALAPDADGLLWLPEDAFEQAFAQQASTSEQAVMAAVQRPISIECITVPVGRPSWRDTPNWYLIAEDDRMISGENQRFMAERASASIVSTPLDHCPMLGNPDLVTEMILAAVGA
ncbi:alpha/beta fold hydrolase [Sphingopyxis panaciterrae]